MFLFRNILFYSVISLLFSGSLTGSKTLEEKLYEIDRLRSGFNTPFDEVEKRCNELLKEYTDPNDQGKIYFELVQVEGQSGFQRPTKILEFINKALECPQEPLKETRLYIYWGDAIQTANRGVHNQELVVARREAAMPYLLGLKETLKYSLPETKPKLPSVNRERYAGPPGTNEYLEIIRRNEEQMNAWRFAKLQRDMIDHRDISNGQIASMYSRFPWASEEIRELATKILQDKTAVDRLMVQVDKGVQQRVKELGWEPQPPDDIPPITTKTQKEDANQITNIEDKKMFIPDANTALKQGKEFVFDIAGGKLLNPGAEINLEKTNNNLLKLGKGDIAWDGSIITLRKAKALTILDESKHPLKYIPGKWCEHYQLPDKASLPYSFVIITNESINYLVTIQKIEAGGITISYRKLSSDDVKLYIKTQENQGIR